MIKLGLILLATYLFFRGLQALREYRSISRTLDGDGTPRDPGPVGGSAGPPG